MRLRLKRFYQKWVIPRLRERCHYKNIHQIPCLKKITINRGLGNLAQQRTVLESSSSELAIIRSQRPLITRARTAISGFKLREKTPVGLITTLRGERGYAFLDRLINLALPRIRDFRGLNSKSFDGQGNYTFGLTEQLIFPEVSYDKIERLSGMDLSLVTTAKNNEASIVFLISLGIRFKDVVDSCLYPPHSVTLL